MAGKKILIFAANPKDTVPLRLAEEAREIGNSLKIVQSRNEFDVVHQWAVRISDLQEALLTHKPKILHFLGHGAAEKGLILENLNGNSQFVGAEALAKLFKLCNTECVVLNACYTEIQANVIAQHIPYVVGMNQAIWDATAISFARGFYMALGSGRSYQDAFSFGQNSLDLENSSEKLAPILTGFAVGTLQMLTSESLPVSKSENTESTDIQQSEESNDSPIEEILLEQPGGMVNLDSAFYINFPELEKQCCEAISKPGSLIRIKAAPQMGKSSLVLRMIHHVNQEGYQSVRLSFQSADFDELENLDSFLYWFCESITEELGLSNKIKDYWDEQIGFTTRCTRYFKKYLLPQINDSLVLALDQVDEIFRVPKIAADFFKMIRGWHEESRSELLWKKIRLVIAHSEAFHAPDIKFSPFNVGMVQELKGLDESQVEDFAKRHGIVLSPNQLQKIMKLLGGNPYLIHIAFYNIASQKITLEELFLNSSKQVELYDETLSLYLRILEDDDDLLSDFKLVLNENYSMQIKSKSSLKLQSMGLIKYQDDGNELIPFCDLYSQYFCIRLGIS